MLPLFELMMQAQNGKAVEALARHMNLAQDQAAKAVTAMMPAFSAGFKRQSSNPFEFATLMQKASSGNYASYFEDLGLAFTPQGMADGQAALEQIFGSQDVARAVAEQAAAFTGLQQDVLKQIMPALANTVLGGIFKEITGQMGKAATNSFIPQGMVALQRQWLEGLGLSPKGADPIEGQMKAMFDNPFIKAMQDMVTAKPDARAETADPFSLNPLVKSFQDMMASAMTMPSSSDQAEQSIKDDPKTGPADAYQSFVNALFEPGLDVQKSYQANLDAIFEQSKPKR